MGALLIACLALKEYSTLLEPPKHLRRQNIKRFENCSRSVREAVDCELTWPEIMANLLLEPDKRRPGASNNDKFLTAPKQPKANTKKTFATLEATPVVELKNILRGIDPNLKVTGKKQELVERIVRHRPIAPSVTVQPDAAARPGLAALDMVAKSKKTKRTSVDDEPKSVSKKTKREIDSLTNETARFLGSLVNIDEPRKKTVSSRLTFPS